MANERIFWLDSVRDRFRLWFLAYNSCGRFSRKGETLGEDSYREHRGLASIRSDHIICLECDKALQLLSNRHLAMHGLTPDAYRQKWCLSPDTSLTSKRLAQRRQQLAHSIGQCELALDATEAEMDFFHELAEALTVIYGQVHLAQKCLSSYTVPQPGAFAPLATSLA